MISKIYSSHFKVLNFLIYIELKLAIDPKEFQPENNAVDGFQSDIKALTLPEIPLNQPP